MPTRVELTAVLMMLAGAIFILGGALPVLTDSGGRMNVLYLALGAAFVALGVVFAAGARRR